MYSGVLQPAAAYMYSVHSLALTEHTVKVETETFSIVN